MDPRILDKEYRIEHLYTIKDKDANKVQFKKNKAQAHFNKNKHTRNIILKSRQLGFSTYEAIDSLDDALFNKNFSAIILNYEQKEAVRIFSDKISFAWDNFPELLRNLYSVDANRANQLTFGFGDNSSSNIATAAEGRGGTFNRVHITELAKLVKKYPQKASTLIASVMPAVPVTGRIDIESTAEGSDGLFYKMFWEAYNRNSDRELLPTEFKAHFYNWQWDEEINDKHVVIPFDQMDQSDKFKEYSEKHKLSPQEISYYYLRFISVNKDWNKMRQEYPTTPEEAFVGSGHKMFEEEDLKVLKPTLRMGKEYQEWIFYEDYIDEHFYCMGVDVAEGNGDEESGDHSTIIILDITDEQTKVVAEFCSKKTPPDLLAYEIVRGANKYGDPIVAVERNNHGYTTLATLKGMYGNIYTEVKEDKITDTITEKLGWWTSGSSKPKMMYELSELIKNRNLVISSKALYEELRTYDKDDLRRTKFDPDQSKHWDRVMALAIAYQMKAFAFETSDIEFHNI